MAMTALDKKITELFPGLTVRKDLVKAVRGNAIVPAYVLEYLLAQHCATNDEDTIQSGIETVQNILRTHYVHRNEAMFVRSRIREKGQFPVIDRVTVILNDKINGYEAEFANLGIKNVPIDAETVKANPKLLVGGIWCITTLQYIPSDQKSCSWLISRLKPIQLASFDLEEFLRIRKEFSLDEWKGLLLQTLGFCPDQFDFRRQMHLLTRLIPFCERNFNLLELGPKGTGKSHVYSEFSPHGILLSGGEVTVPKLFVNNSTGKIGLVGYWDCVAFDEFAGRKRRVDKSLVDIMKNYMANRSFSRGIETLGAEASMAFVGNTEQEIGLMLRHSNLFADLPANYYDSAFLDRIHNYLPGWEMENLRENMYSTGYGFVVDYFAEILRALRDYDYTGKYLEYFDISSSLSTRDKDGVNKTFSGLLKILFPDGKAGKNDMEGLLEFAMESRKRVKDQLQRMDQTYAKVNFSFTDKAGVKREVRTREEMDFQDVYAKMLVPEENISENYARMEPLAERDLAHRPAIKPEKAVARNGLAKDEPREDHRVFEENSMGVSYERLFGPYLENATRIVVTDPYIRLYYQARNFMELLELLARLQLKKAQLSQTGAIEEKNRIELELVTTGDDFHEDSQREWFERMTESAARAGIYFKWRLVEEKQLHARHIATDTGWKIILDRGLDIFQPYDMKETFALEGRLQELRPCKQFEITWMKMKEGI